jgi:hypothetical protein
MAVTYNEGKDPEDVIARITGRIPLSQNTRNGAAGAIAELLPGVPWSPDVAIVGQIQGIAESVQPDRPSKLSDEQVAYLQGR